MSCCEGWTACPARCSQGQGSACTGWRPALPCRRPHLAGHVPPEEQLMMFKHIGESDGKRTSNMFSDNGKENSGALQVGGQDECATLVALLRACSKSNDLYKGNQIHDDILHKGLLDKCSDALVTMYAKCGELEKAKVLLYTHKSRDVTAWTALIVGYARDGQGQAALDCFECMQRDGILADAVTYTSILKACAAVEDAERGKAIHNEIERQGFLQNNTLLATAVIDMYAKCGYLAEAEGVFEEVASRDVVAWSALIAGYAQNGQGEQALAWFERMQVNTVLPNAVTYCCILKACASIGAIDKGIEIHEKIERQGLLDSNIILGNALVDMYVKCGALSKARRVFEELPFRNLVSWNALIAGYAQEGQGEEAMDAFESMQHDGIFPDSVTYVCILKACAALGAADRGKEIHDEVTRQGLLQKNIVLGNALIDVYAKCGLLPKAQHVFWELPGWDVISWNSLIAGYAQKGQVEQALNCLNCMQADGIVPDEVTFISILNACSHLGLLEEGHVLFVKMSTKYGVNSNFKCYACMIQLFARAGHLEMPVQLIQEMPASDYAAIWLALLGASQKCGDINVGLWAFEQIVDAAESDSLAYVLMSNVLAGSGMQGKANGIKAMEMRNKTWRA